MTSLEEFAKAIEKSDSSKVQSLIDNGSVDVNARLPRDRNPPALVLAASCKQKEIVDILLRANARIDDADDYRWTACHAAVLSRRDDVLALLLAHLPNLGRKSSFGRTELDYSVEIGSNERITAMLIEAGALDSVDRDNMCRLAGQSTVVIQALLDRGVVVSDLRDVAESSPLHWAARSAFNPAVWSMLVNVCGVDFDAQDRDGNTCLHFNASSSNTPYHLRWFVQVGASVDIANDAGLTPLHYACLDVFCEDILVLLAAGANVHARDSSGNSALRLLISPRPDGAWCADDIAAIALALIAVGAEIDNADRDSVIPRQLLAEHGLIIDEAEVESVRRDIAKQRIDFVRDRAFVICIGLQSQGLDALQMCEILLHSCGPLAPLIPFHIWWKIATTVKHFSVKRRTRRARAIRLLGGAQLCCAQLESESLLISMASTKPKL